MQVPIVFCADANYGQYLSVVVQSIIENASFEHEYHIIVFDCGIKPEDLAVLNRQLFHVKNFSIEIKSIEERLALHKAVLKNKSYFTQASYGRLFIPEFCGHYEKLIYADVDIIFNRDIAGLMTIDLGDNFIAGVADFDVTMSRQNGHRKATYLSASLGLSQQHTYINSGILVFNTQAWQENTITDKIISFLQYANKLRYPDQDAINAVCKDKILYLSEDWNNHSFSNQYYTVHGKFSKKVVHYTSAIKPWHSLAVREANIWWYYAAKTENYDRLLCEASIQKSGIILEEGSSFYHCLFGVPVLRGKIDQTKIKYYLFGMRHGHIATWQNDTEKATKSFYLFGLKLFSKKTSS